MATDYKGKAVQPIGKKIDVTKDGPKAPKGGSAKSTPALGSSSKVFASTTPKSYPQDDFSKKEMNLGSIKPMKQTTAGK